MDALSTTSERRKVKVTYANRNKRRSTDKDTDDGASERSAGSETEYHASGDVVMSISSSHGPAEPQAKVHKRVDSLDLPGPAPRNKRSGSKDSLSRKKFPAHDRTSSIDHSSITRSPKSPRRPDKPHKPLSVLSAKLPFASKNRFHTPEAPSSPSISNLPGISTGHASDTSEKVREKTKRTTEAERKAYFDHHPDVAEVEEHRVLCRACSKWLKLHATQKYALSAWKAHKLLCSPSKKKKTKRTSLSADNVAGGSDAEEAHVDDDASSIAPSVSASDASASITATSISLSGTNARHIRHGTDERQHILEQDELTGEVREHEVFCTPCGKWVRLSNRTTFALSHWTKHAERVHGRRSDAPSSRVQEAERKLQLVNDSQAKEFATNRVVCKVCDETVALSAHVPYELKNWTEHKLACPSPSTSESTTLSTPITSMTNNLAPPNIQSPPKARPPPSTSSTDATFVGPAVPVSNSGSPLSIIGQKRSREDEEGEPIEGESPAVRQRTEDYLPPDEKPSGPWGWFLLPWQTFKRGFSEGFWASSEAPLS